MTNKEKRAESIRKQAQHHKHLRSEIIQSGLYRPSIWVECEFNSDLQEYIDTNRIKRASRSKRQKWMKKVTKRRVRKLPLEALPTKGNQYRKVFDYWWEWY